MFIKLLLQLYRKYGMIESLMYSAIGFVTAYLSLEGLWHAVACKTDKSLAPCFYRQLKMIITK